MLLVETTQIDVTDPERRIRMGEDPPTPAYTDDTGELYRSLQRAYGRCTGTVYVDGPSGVRRVGWVFLRFDGYLCETWVTLHDRPPVTAVTYHDLPARQ
jgi:hypothetical protein